MREFINMVLLAINIIFGIAVSILSLMWFFYEILGPELFKNILSFFYIAWNFNILFKVSYICLVIFLVILFIRKKVLGE